MAAPTTTTTATTTTAADAAPVLEFRCLFSRDGHKKRKTFHDGTLKFHTFNARVMVYDLDHHYVGDLHYRHDDDFDEGLEFRLDSGVVVQVQDRLGQTLTPLDQVLSCKRNTTNSITTPTTSSSSSRQPLRPIPAVSQQRPRSLKDVLAASQHATCRPRAPVLTPHEQKPLSDQSARKRHKHTGATIAKDTTTALPFQDIVDLSSDDEPSQPQPQPSKLQKQTPPRPRPQPRAKSLLPCPKVPLCLPPQKARPRLMYRTLLAPSRPSPPHSLISLAVPGVQIAGSRKLPLGQVASEADASSVDPCRAPPALMKTTFAPPLVPNREPPAQESSGPWTSQEAFLLFDWWPASKNKPDYGTRT